MLFSINTERQHLRSSIEQIKEETNSEEFPYDISPEEIASLDNSVEATDPVLSEVLIIVIARKGDDQETDGW